MAVSVGGCQPDGIKFSAATIRDRCQAFCIGFHCQGCNPMAPVQFALDATKGSAHCFLFFSVHWRIFFHACIPVPKPDAWMCSFPSLHRHCSADVGYLPAFRLLATWRGPDEPIRFAFIGYTLWQIVQSCILEPNPRMLQLLFFFFIGLPHVVFLMSPLGLLSLATPCGG